MGRVKRERKRKKETGLYSTNLKYTARQTENGPPLPRSNSNLQAYMDEPKDR